MPTVTFVLGLCGAGKTWLANHLDADARFDENFLLDPSQHDALIAVLRLGQDAVVVEIAYCHEEARAEILGELRNAVPNLTVRWLCVENNLMTANKNCRERTNKGEAERHIDINRRLSPNYTYPEDAVILPMWTRA